ncbi:diguanylate cyclase [Comamonas serinivorans]|uniref:Diguanylate cyclase n=1 Tax=Comamonas serinivorans TaxID=1082851 RepID=A0A1Y0EKL3_9BURK|nr:GAF domain-containing protein [Comamonas serinivorans]ARU04183.1 diguanylate cyclase [Comamonas serinivorans]
MSLHLWDYPPEALEVTVSELLIATASSSDKLIDDTVREVLHDLREHLSMDVIFFSEIRDGQRMFKHVDTKPGCEVIATGGGSSLEESFCQCVLEGKLPQLVHDAAVHPAFPQLPPTPFRVGAHLSAPIVLGDGRTYGTLCCFSHEGDETLTERDLQKLECVARVAAKRIDARRQRVRDDEMQAWALEPLASHPLGKPTRRI